MIITTKLNPKPKNILKRALFELSNKLLLRLFLILFLTVILMANNTVETFGATYIVNNNSDISDGNCDSNCSLREAVAAANTTPDDDIINFSSFFNINRTITLSGSEITISNNGTLTINGTGVNHLTVTGNSNSRVLFIAGATVTLNGLYMTGGNGIGAFSASGGGGGIYNSNGNLTIADSSVSDNLALSSVGGGGVYNETGMLTVIRSKINNNTPSDEGGGIFNEAGTVNITNSTLSGNGVGNLGGAIVNNNGTMTITGSTLNSNTSSLGAGIYNDKSLTIVNSTINNNNSSSNGGGIYNANGGIVNITNATISSNSADFGGGLINDGVTNLQNTIVADNSASFGSPDIFGIITSQGYNLIENTNGVSGTVASDITGVDPNLGPLQGNAGLTQTQQLLTGSPAIDKGSAVTPALITDQRGFTRPYDNPAIGNAPGGNGSDIGAYEVHLPGFEGDVSDRPLGDTSIDSLDVVQVRRFQIGFDLFTANVNEFQRADAAPFDGFGDGFVDSLDVVQVRRYQIGFDPKSPGAGPLERATIPQSAMISKWEKSLSPRSINVVDTKAYAGQTVSVTIAVDTFGDESSYGFSLNYDSNVLSNPNVRIGKSGGDVMSNTTIDGQIGISVDFSGSTILRSRQMQLISIQFDVNPKADSGRTLLNFENTLTNKSVSNSLAQPLNVNFEDGFIDIIGRKKVRK